MHHGSQGLRFCSTSMKVVDEAAKVTCWSFLQYPTVQNSILFSYIMNQNKGQSMF
jgi:hypothetical protein